MCIRDRYYGKVVYQDWVDCAAEIVMYYQAREIRPTFLFGLSAGGILAYQTASGLPEIQGVIATCLLDQREPLVRKSVVSSGWMAEHGLRLISKASAWLGFIKAVSYTHLDVYKRQPVSCVNVLPVSINPICS